MVGSDLHFCGGTANEENLAPRAFEIVFADANATAERRVARTGRELAQAPRTATHTDDLSSSSNTFRKRVARTGDRSASPRIRSPI